MLLPPRIQEIALDDGIVWHPLCEASRFWRSKCGWGKPSKAKGEFPTVLVEWVPRILIKLF